MNIWVFAQTANGVASSATLELLTKARSLGTATAFCAGVAGDAAAVFGDHGAARVYETGDLGGALPGAAVAGAMKAVIDGGDTPDLIMFPQNYEGRDVMARLSVKLDRTVITNNTDVTVDGGSVTVTTPVFGGNPLVATTTLFSLYFLNWLMSFTSALGSGDVSTWGTRMRMPLMALMPMVIVSVAKLARTVSTMTAPAA